MNPMKYARAEQGTARSAAAAIACWSTVFAVSWAVIVFAALWPAWSFVAGPAVLESGDFAANALQIADAKFGGEWLGNYSRWGFNHPGPAFFYVYAIGEWLLADGLGVVASPHQAHVAAGIALQAAFIAASAALVATSGRQGWTKAFVLLAVTVFVAARTPWAISSIWAPHVLFGPTLLLVVASAQAYAGRAAALILLVIASVFCVHGHVAQPLIVVPIFLAAIWGYWRNAIGPLGIRSQTRVMAACGSLVLLGLLPIGLDALLSPKSNLSYILDYLKVDHGPTPTWDQATRYLLGYLAFEHHPESAVPEGTWAGSTALSGLLVLIGLVILGVAFRSIEWIGSRHRQSVRKSSEADRVAAMTGFALLLALLWCKRVTGELYEFNAFFVYALLASLLYSVLAMGLRAWPSNQVASGLVTLIAGLMLFNTFAMNRLPAPFSAAETYLRPGPVVTGARQRSGVLLSFEHAEWPIATALAIELKREGVPYFVTPEWATLFGRDRVLDFDRIVHGQELAPQIVEAFLDRMPAKGAPLTSSAFRSAADLKPVNSAAPAQSVTALMREGGLLGFGTSEPDGEFAFTVGEGTILQFRRPLEWRESTGKVRLLLEPFLAGSISSQRVLYNDGASVVEQVLGSGAELVVAPTCGLSICSVVLRTPDAFSPASAGVNIDQRALGLKLMQIRFEHPAAPSAAPTQEPLVADGQGYSVAALLRSGKLRADRVSEPSGNFVFTTSERALISFRKPTSWRDGVGQAQLRLEPFIAGQITGQRVRLYGAEVGKEHQLTGAAVLAIRPACAQSVCSVEIATPDAFSPASAGVSTDQRRLGVKIISLAVSGP